MGILPMSVTDVSPVKVEGIHGQDARATHGLEAHATRTRRPGSAGSASCGNVCLGGYYGFAGLSLAILLRDIY